MSREIQKETENPVPAAPVLEVKHLFKSFGENRVLQDFSLCLYKREALVILGKSGSGKSVLIKCIIGLLQPDQGSIEVFGKNIPGMHQQELDNLRVKLGFLFQSNALYDSMTVRENLEFPLRRHRLHLSNEKTDQLVTEALQEVGLVHTAGMLPSELSGGMRKRIALARTLILQPEIILYDEPTTGLDPVTGREIILLMKKIQAKFHTSSIIISHDLNCVRLAGNRVIILEEGRCYAEGNFESLRQNTDPHVKQYFESYTDV